MPLSLDESGWSCFSTSLSPDVSSAMMGTDVYAPMSMIKQSLEGVMSDQVETLWVQFVVPSAQHMGALALAPNTGMH